MTDDKKTTEKTSEDVSSSTKEEKVLDKTAESKKEEPGMADLRPGMTIRIHQKIKELNLKGEEKERVQYFEGIVIAKKHGNEAGGTITVRKVSNGVGVEKIFPINLPTISKVEIKKIAKVSRAKLFFLKKGYRKKLKETVVK